MMCEESKQASANNDEAGLEEDVGEEDDVQKAEWQVVMAKRTGGNSEEGSGDEPPNEDEEDELNNTDETKAHATRTAVRQTNSRERKFGAT